MQAKETLAEPKEVEYWSAEPNKKLFGPKFRKDAPAVESAIEALSEDLKSVFYDAHWYSNTKLSQGETLIRT